AYPPGHSTSRPPQPYKPRKSLDTSGSFVLYTMLDPLKDPSSLQELREAVVNLGHRKSAQIDAALGSRLLPDAEMFKGKFEALVFKASMLLYEGDAKQAYQVLQDARTYAQSSPRLA